MGSIGTADERLVATLRQVHRRMQTGSCMTAVYTPPPNHIVTREKWLRNSQRETVGRVNVKKKCYDQEWAQNHVDIAEVSSGGDAVEA